MAVIDINWHPSRRDLRLFAALQMVFFAVVDYLVFQKTGSRAAVIAISIVSVVIGIAGLVQPAWIRPVYVGWMGAAFPIGWVVSHLVLAIIYYLVFTPFGLTMKLFGRDPLNRKIDRGAKSYWVPRPEQRDSSRYFRQF